VWDQIALYHSKDILTIYQDCKRIISYYIKQPVPVNLPEITRIVPESLQKPRSSKEISLYNWTYINFPILQEECIALESFTKQGNYSSCRRKYVALSCQIKCTECHITWVPFITTWHVLKLQMEKTAFKYGECLWMSQTVTDSWQGVVLQCGV
jgi:hypothetical protein